MTILDLSSLTALLDLSLANNKLTGGIPPEIGALTRLETRWLHHNRLSGEIPGELGNLANLEELLLGTNNLRGRYRRRRAISPRCRVWPSATTA